MGFSRQVGNACGFVMNRHHFLRVQTGDAGPRSDFVVTSVLRFLPAAWFWAGGGVRTAPAYPTPRGAVTLPPLPAMVANLAIAEQTKAAGVALPGLVRGKAIDPRYAPNKRASRLPLARPIL